MSSSQESFVVLDEFGVEQADGVFVSMIVGEFPTKRAALKVARDYVRSHRDKHCIVTRGHSNEWADLLAAVYAGSGDDMIDDFDRAITTETYGANGSMRASTVWA